MLSRTPRLLASKATVGGRLAVNASSPARPAVAEKGVPFLRRGSLLGLGLRDQLVLVEHGVEAAACDVRVLACGELFACAVWRGGQRTVLGTYTPPRARRSSRGAGASCSSTARACTASTATARCTRTACTARADGTRQSARTLCASVGEASADTKLARRNAAIPSSSSSSSSPAGSGAVR